MLDFFVLIILTINLVILVYLYQHDLVTVGDFAFVITTTDISWYIWDYFGEQFFQMIQESMAGAVQGFNYLRSLCIIRTRRIKPLQVRDGAIEFSKINYYYNESNKLFDEFDCLIRPGEKVGLVGYSGSGKTTLLHLFLRFLPVKSGDILIDGQPLSQVTLALIRESISMIPQDTTLFHRTIRDNICYGKRHAGEEDVVHAARQLMRMSLSCNCLRVTIPWSVSGRQVVWWSVPAHCDCSCFC